MLRLCLEPPSPACRSLPIRPPNSTTLLKHSAPLVRCSGCVNTTLALASHPASPLGTGPGPFLLTIHSTWMLSGWEPQAKWDSHLLNKYCGPGSVLRAVDMRHLYGYVDTCPSPLSGTLFYHAAQDNIFFHSYSPGFSPSPLVQDNRVDAASPANTASHCSRREVESLGAHTSPPRCCPETTPFLPC